MEVSLTNQTEITQAVINKSRENNEAGKLKEIESGRIKDNEQKMESNNEDKDDTEDVCLVRGFFLIFCLIFIAIAGYWTSQVVENYKSEPVYSTVNMVETDTFTWPTITIEPQRQCFNETALEEIRKAYNITKLDDKTKYFPTFEIPMSFNSSVNNLSEIYLMSKYSPPVTHFPLACYYFNSATNELNIDCLNPKNGLGKWETYDTQWNAKEAFTAAPATNIADYIHIYFNARIKCNFVILSIHPSSDRYYNAYPSVQYFSVNPGQTLDIRVGVEHFHRINTKASPCVEGTKYTRTQCYDAKIIEFKTKKAGCHFPGITGYHHQVGNYPECNNASSYKEFMFWHYELYRFESKYGELQKMKQECGVPCHRQKYFITDKKEFATKSWKKAYSSLIIRMESGAMLYQLVEEKRAMTMDMVVGNVGGTIGMFLGVSCLSGINVIQFMLKKIIRIYRNVS